MTLIKTSLLNGIAVFVRLMTLLGINKLLAIYVGPVGYVALGQFQNAVTMITTIAGSISNIGIIKYTSEYYDDETHQRILWQTSGSIALISSLVISLLVAIFSKSIAILFLKDAFYAGVFHWFAGMLIFFVFNTLLLAMLNGKKEIRRFVVANIAGSLFSLCLTAVLVIFYGLYGALAGLAVYQSFAFFVTFSLCQRASWFKLNYLFGKIDPVVAKNLLKYAFMAIASAICIPGSQLLIRNYLGNTLGWESAGYWEAMVRLSAAYLILITSTLGVYYLPQLSELREYKDITREINSAYKLILPVVILCGVFIYFLRDFIIGVVFSARFMPMRELFAWQMLGDAFKISSWILSYLMLGKAMFRLYISAEIFFAASYFLLTICFVNLLGFKGVALAYAVNYFFYWIIMHYLTSRYVVCS